MKKYKEVKPNLDKPHRCPKCHSIPEEAQKDGMALQDKLYACGKCRVFWYGPKEHKDLKNGKVYS